MYLLQYQVYLRNAVMFCFLTDVVLKTYALRKQYFDMPNSYIEFASGIMIIVYCLASWLWELGQ